MTKAEFDRVYLWAVSFGPPVTTGMTYRVPFVENQFAIVLCWVRGQKHNHRTIASMDDFYAFLDDLHAFLADVTQPMPGYVERHLEGLLAPGSSSRVA